MHHQLFTAIIITMNSSNMPAKPDTQAPETKAATASLLQRISFFDRFKTDILQGSKTITLRNEAESHVQAGQILPVSSFETDEWFCDIEILSRTTVAFNELNQTHAAQENMQLEALKDLIQVIYPGIHTLYEIQFKRCDHR
jgi:uncharacterized protein YqfB (UPF0267 family)